MQIKFGEIYVNKTWKYLFPITKVYGPGFRNKITHFFKLAVGIADAHYKDAGRCIFILIDREYYRNMTLTSINWLRYQPYYVDDYPYDDLQTGRMHMLVIKFPEEFSDAYDEFLKGRYSRMFTPEQIDTYFSKDTDMSGAYKVLTREKVAYTEFIEKIKNSFGEVTVTEEDLVGAELDFPIEKQKEIFNYGVV